MLNGAAAPVPAVRATFIYATSPRGGLDTTTENVTRILSEREFSEALQRGERFMDASPEAYGAYLTTWRKVLRAAPEGAVVSVANSGEHSSEPTGALEILHDRGRKFLPFIWPPRSVGEALTLDLGSNGNDASGTKGPMTLTCLQASPKAFYVQNFLSDQEAEELIAFAQSEKNPYRLRPSTTGHKSWTQGGESSTNTKRTSLNGFDISSPTGKRIKRRAFQLARIEPYDEKLADGIQVLRYEPGQAYIPHTDYFAYRTSNDHLWDPRIPGGTNRFATVFLYLSDVAAGGHTVFPKVPRAKMRAEGSPSLASAERAEKTNVSHAVNLSHSSWEAKMAGECETAFSVPPRKGDALLFYSQQPDGSLDEMSFHGGCPVLDGIKWAANVWIWNGCRYGVCKNPPPAHRH